MTNKINEVGVVGGGQMGLGIAQVLAAKGITTILCDISSTQLETAQKSIHASLTKLVSKNVLTQSDMDATLKRLSFDTNLQSLKNCDLVIEAIVENEAVKAQLFKNLDTILRPQAILASNTSSIPITKLAAATLRPKQFIGMHFMNPVPLMKLVEIIPGMQTSEEVKTQVVELAHFLGKETVMSQDFPGFIVNRVLMPMINEAFYTLMEGVASAKDIDTGMKLGTNQPMGPLTLADFIGLDTCLAIMKVLHDGLGDSKYRPCPLLVKYVQAGYLGKKTKRGVYPYES